MRLIENIVDLIAPLHCIICGVEGSIACEPCIAAELINLPSCCFYCAKITTYFNVCDKCSKKSPLKAVWCVTEYGSFAQSVIKAYKYDAIRAVKGTVVKEMIKVLPANNFLITSIPTASNRIRQRGFDHCLLIAKEIAKQRKLNYSTLLYRTSSVHQVGSNKTERLNQTKDLFYIKNFQEVSNQSILLIDDVATTGATMQSAARVLNKAGAKEIYGLVFAKNL